MKKLQNNFTTPEQSKRLLELGVLADSADCYKIESELYDQGIRVRYSDYELNPLFFSVPNRIPIWSVGRLIEIALICHDSTSAHIAFDRPLYDISCCTNIDWAIRCIESAHKTGHMDFSKLEE